MSTGQELSDLLPTVEEYKLISDGKVKELLEYIFKRNADGKFKKSISKVRNKNCILFFPLILFILDS